MKQRIFSLVIVLVVFVTSFAVVPVPVKAADFGESLETLENATMSAVYETIRKLGYKFVEIPFGDDSAFTEVMKPIVDQMVDNGLDPTSLFRRLGNQLYYNIGEVANWVIDVFGDGLTGILSNSSSVNSYSVDFNTYNTRLTQARDYAGASSNVVNFGSMYGYPYFYCDQYSTPVIPFYNYGGTTYFYNTFVGDVVSSVSGVNYIFYLKALNSSSNTSNVRFYSTFSDSYLLNVVGSSVIGFRYNLPSGPSYGAFYAYTPTYYFYHSVSASSYEEALSSFLNYVDSHLYNMYYDFNINGVRYNNFPSKYVIERPSVPSSEPSGYVPVNYDYVINNFGDATYIYEGDTIINGVTGSVIQVELVSPSAVHVIVDNMDDFSNETNNQIINDYDFDFGDLNIGGAIDASAGHIGDGLNDVATGSALGVLNGFAQTVPADIRIMVFSFVAIALIAGVIGKVSGG